MRTHAVAVSLLTVVGLSLTGCEDGPFAEPKNDPFFSLECSIPTSGIYDGGPGPDGIPALDYPTLVGPWDGTLTLDDDDRVLGLEHDEAARAYPLRVLWWHEIVNDTLGGRNVLVTYCPLTGSGVVFDRLVNGEARLFGVSGLLYENNLMMFDRTNRSLWNQLLLGSQCGVDRGTELARLPVVETTWGHWRRWHAHTTVVSPNTGLDRPYDTYPYGTYDQLNDERTLFPSAPWDRSRPAKELVLGVRDGDNAVAYPFSMLDSLGTAVALNDSIGARPILVTYVGRERTARAFDRRIDSTTLTFDVVDSLSATYRDVETGSLWRDNGVAVSGPLADRRLAMVADAFTLFWFAWSVNYPDTQLP
jgi:hypothetical protein